MSLYAREELLEHMKSPYNQGKIENSTVSSIAKNPFCGDIVNIYMVIDGNNIKDCKFDGESCGVCTASASMLTEEIIGSDLDKAKNLTKDDVVAMLGTTLTTSRLKCATLPLEAIKDAINKYEQR